MADHKLRRVFPHTPKERDQTILTEYLLLTRPLVTQSDDPLGLAARRVLTLPCAHARPLLRTDNLPARSGRIACGPGEDEKPSALALALTSVPAGGCKSKGER